MGKRSTFGNNSGTSSFAGVCLATWIISSDWLNTVSESETAFKTFFLQNQRFADEARNGD